VEPVELLFKPGLVKRVIAVGHFKSNICPILWPQRVERRRKYNALFHGHVLPFVVNKVANDADHVLAYEVLVVQDAIDRLGDSAQTLFSFLVLGFKSGRSPRPNTSSSRSSTRSKLSMLRCSCRRTSMKSVILPSR
jgi:hypothetical protein